MTGSGSHILPAAKRRFQIAHFILTEPGAWSRARLAAHYGLSERQIDKDIAVIRSVNDVRHRRSGYAIEQVEGSMSKRLEAPDEQITLKRAAELGGLSAHTLSDAARDRRLDTTMPGSEYLTTRRKLHRFLINRKRGRVAPLPEGYQVPEGEAPIHSFREDV